MRFGRYPNNGHLPVHLKLAVEAQGFRWVKDERLLCVLQLLAGSAAE